MKALAGNKVISTEDRIRQILSELPFVVIHKETFRNGNGAHYLLIRIEGGQEREKRVITLLLDQTRNEGLKICGFGFPNPNRIPPYFGEVPTHLIDSGEIFEISFLG